jgi:hypothetical protein
MILDVTQFGYGCGLVMVGWVAGMVVNFAFKAFERF